MDLPFRSPFSRRVRSPHPEQVSTQLSYRFLWENWWGGSWEHSWKEQLPYFRFTRSGRRWTYRLRANHETFDYFPMPSKNCALPRNTFIEPSGCCNTAKIVLFAVLQGLSIRPALRKLCFRSPVILIHCKPRSISLCITLNLSVLAHLLSFVWWWSCLDTDSKLWKVDHQG